MCVCYGKVAANKKRHTFVKRIKNGSALLKILKALPIIGAFLKAVK